MSNVAFSVDSLRQPEDWSTSNDENSCCPRFWTSAGKVHEFVGKHPLFVDIIYVTTAQVLSIFQNFSFVMVQSQFFSSQFPRCVGAWLHELFAFFSSFSAHRKSTFLNWHPYDLVISHIFQRGWKVETSKITESSSSVSYGGRKFFGTSWKRWFIPLFIGF